MIQEPANLPICCSLLLLRLLHLLHPPLQQMAAAGRHINLLTSLPQNKKTSRRTRGKKHQNTPLLTYCINRKIFNKDEEQIQRRNGRRKKSWSSSPPSPLLRNQSKRREEKRERPG
jgi:hypothetical protein